MAIALAGASEGINLGIVTVTKNRSALTAMAWVRFAQVLATATKVFGYSIGTNAANSRFTLQWASGTPGQLQIGARALDADPQRVLLSSTVLAAGPWRHVACVVDFSTFPAPPNAAIYIDGELDIAGPLDGALGAATTDSTNSLGAGIGVREGGAGQQGMAGDIEDFRLYDGILGAATIQSIHTSKGKDGVTGGLLHRYQLNDLGHGEAVVGVACLADAERIVGLPLGAPTFSPGVSSSRSRQRMPRAARAA